MASRNGAHSLPARPPLSTHQSNSVPSTPHQHPRDFPTRSRSPSPELGLEFGLHSPRSVASEANHVTMTALPKGRPTCKYETAAAYTRRRMQYDIGDAPLERPEVEPKKTLDPHEEKKLSGDMRELYDRLYPSDESNERRLLFVKKLEDILRKRWPGTEFNVHIFGSHANSLCTSESDVDVCIQTPMKELESMHMLAEALANNGMERVICISAAKVPIVKIWDPVLNVAADMNVNNTLALENTRMIKSYVEIDARVRPMGLMIKHWVKQRILNDAGIGGTLSSYAWTCMILNFLQTREPPVLPALHQYPHKDYTANDGTESGFTDDLDSFKTFGAANKETIGDLLFHFFRHYAYDYDYDNSVVSVRHGKHLTRIEKGWAGASKEGQWRLCIEEPFNVSRNLGNSADPTAFRGIHLELRRAFDLLADGAQLDRCCEQYHFPPEDKPYFKKPVAGPKPVLSAAQPVRGGRGGSQIRNSRHNVQRSAAGYRRSSSGASFGRSPHSPFVHSSPSIPQSAEYVSAAAAANSIQDHLLHQSQLYGHQIERLQQRMVWSHFQAQVEAHSQATAHAHSLVHAPGQSSRDASTTVSPQKTPYPSEAHSLHMASAYLEYLNYPYEMHQLDQQSPDGSRSNPPSPSLSASIPVRRTVQRSSLVGDGQGASVRSQSQPPRAGPQAVVHPGYPQMVPIQGVPYFTFPNPAALVDQQAQQTRRGVDVPMGFDPLSRTASLPVYQDSPKEYIGYYMHDPRQMQTQPPSVEAQQRVPSSFSNLAQIPQYSELASRRNGPSSEMKLTFSNVRQASSRSPSPFGHQRTFSTPLKPNTTGLKSAPLQMLPSLGRAEKGELTDLTQQKDEQLCAPTGLLIVNGSSYPSSTVEQHAFAFGDGDTREVPGHLPFRYGDIPALNGEQEVLDEIPALSRQYCPSTFQTTENGLSHHSPPVEVKGNSAHHSPLMAFPPFVDSGLPASRAQDDDATLSPKSTQHSTWRNQSMKPIVTPIDTSKSQDPSKQSEPKSAPLLSPVYEMRSSSPTALRRLEHIQKPSRNEVIPVTNGDIAKENGVPHGTSKLQHNQRSHQVPPTSTGRAITTQSKTPTSATSSTSGHWQMSGKKKKANRKHSKSVGAVVGNFSQTRGDSAKAEASPPHDSERKGG